MNYVITYWTRGFQFKGVFNDDGYAILEDKQDQGEISISEVIELPEGSELVI